MKPTPLALSVRHALVFMMGTSCAVMGMNATATDAPRSTTQDSQLPAAASTAATSEPVQTTKLGTVVVTGQLRALRQAEATKRDAIGVVDSVSAEEVGKFPDQNVADALQRVPGVSVDRSDGAANHITVRGFGPSFVNVLLNGRPMASSSGDRSFNFDVLPSEIIQQAIVHKTGEADVPAGGIGGTVNIITARPLDFSGWHGAATGAMENEHIGGDLISGKSEPKFSGTFGHTNADHTFGWVLDFVYRKRDHTQQQYSTYGWIPCVDYSSISPGANCVSLPQSRQMAVYHENWTHESVGGSIDWKPTDKLTLSMDALFARFKERAAYNGFGLFTDTSDVQSINTDANGTALGFTRGGTGSLANDNIEGLSYQDTHNQQIAGHVKYQFTQASEIDWDNSVSKAWNKPDQPGYFLVVGTRNVGVTPQWTNGGATDLPGYTGIISPTDPSQLRLHYFSSGPSHESDNILRSALHFSTTFETGALARLDFGISARNQKKTGISYAIPDAIGSGYSGYSASVPADAIGAHIFDAGNFFGGSGPAYPKQWLAFDPAKVFQYYLSPQAYNQLSPDRRKAFLDAIAANQAAYGSPFATPQNLNTYSQIAERIRSAYAQATFEGNIGDMPWTLVAGARYTKTDTTSRAYYAPIVSLYRHAGDASSYIPVYGPVQQLSSNGHYFNWLPSASFKLNLTDDLVFRFAASKTLTRPNLSDLSGSHSFNFHPGTNTVTTGNPDLKPYTSKNLDSGIEWYFSEDSYASMDLFFKKVSNFTTLVTHPTTIQGVDFEQTEPVNLNSAIIKGAELTFNYQFHWLPAPFDGLGLASNYTYVTSSASISPGKIYATGRFAVPGIGNSSNVSAYYQKGPVQVRLAWNWRQKYLSSIAGTEGQSTTTRSYGQLDFSSSYQFTKHVSAFLNATNLNNEKIYQYQIYENRLSGAEADGRTVMAGVRLGWD